MLTPPQIPQQRQLNKQQDGVLVDRQSPAAILSRGDGAGATSRQLSFQIWTELRAQSDDSPGQSRSRSVRDGSTGPSESDLGWRRLRGTRWKRRQNGPRSGVPRLGGGLRLLRSLAAFGQIQLLLLYRNVSTWYPSTPEIVKAQAAPDKLAVVDRQK